MRVNVLIALVILVLLLIGCYIAASIKECKLFFFIFIFLLIIFLLITICFWYKLRCKKYKQTLAEYKQQIDINAAKISKLEEEHDKRLLEKRKSDCLIKSLQDENHAMRKEKNLIESLQLTQQKQILSNEEMIQQLKAENVSLKGGNVLSLEELNFINCFKSSRNWFPAEEEWEKLKEIVNKQYPTFPIGLYNSFLQLTEKELRVCYLLKIGLKTASIASLFNTYSNTISMIKKRMLYKIKEEKYKEKRIEDIVFDL